jgi:hypothetical protein
MLSPCLYLIKAYQKNDPKQMYTTLASPWLASALSRKLFTFFATVGGTDFISASHVAGPKSVVPGMSGITGPRLKAGRPPVSSAHFESTARERGPSKPIEQVVATPSASWSMLGGGHMREYQDIRR